MANLVFWFEKIEKTPTFFLHGKKAFKSEYAPLILLLDSKGCECDDGKGFKIKF